MAGYFLEPSLPHCTCCLPPLPINGRFVRLCKQGTLQFVLAKSLLAALTLVLHAQGAYTEGFWGPSDGCAPRARARARVRGVCLRA